MQKRIIPLDMTLEQDILKKIEQEDIAPKPVWHFWVREVVLWGMIALSIVVGGIAGATSWFRLTQSDLPFHIAAVGKKFSAVLIVLPYAWMLLLAIVLWLAYVQLKHTRHGYRMRLWVIALMCIGGSVAFAAGFHQVDMGRKVDDGLRHVKVYNAAFDRERAFWNQPEEGRLIGKIQSIETTSTTTMLLVETPGKDEWMVVVIPALLEELPHPIQQEMLIRVLGSVRRPYMFDATQISLIPPPPKAFLRRGKDKSERK
jgi:hypothetical protein